MTRPTVTVRRIRVGIVDDHAITRRALSEFLSEQGECEVVGVAHSGRDAMDLARTVRMDVMLLDIDMPGRTGMEVLPHILARADAPAVLMLSTHPQEAYGAAMLQKGAAGYLNKQCEPDEIVRVIKLVAGGGRYLGGELCGRMADSSPQPVPLEPHQKLTQREFQVFLRLAQGQSSGEAAHDLALSPSTVATYRVKVMAKVQARTNSELTYYAIKHQLIA